VALFNRQMRIDYSFTLATDSVSRPHRIGAPVWCAHPARANHFSVDKC
jgi:hypothetical protein